MIYNKPIRPAKMKDLTNLKFGKLLVLSFSHTDKKVLFWNCLCDCGVNKIIRGNSLTRKNKPTRSCGCLIKEINSKLLKSKKGHLHYKWNLDRNYILNSNKCAKFMYGQLRNIAHNKNGEHTQHILGYSKKELFKYLESKFDEHMSWQNYGFYWHIDHIIPVSYFVKNDILDPKVINALSNLQPLEAKANIRKGAKL